MAQMPLHEEIEQRFGVLPNFFRLASNTPEVTVNLWGFARFAYLDSPLPSLFKERLFVYLSRFCEVRYCIARHVGFLVGLGYPAGDRHCLPQTIEQVLPLLQRPLLRGEELEPALALCAADDPERFEFPSPDTALETAIFACATHVFLQTPDAPRAMVALRQMLGSARLELINVFLAFVRMAHYWTQTHLELRFEDDINHLLATHETLAVCLLNDPEVKNNTLNQKVLEELAALRQLKGQYESLVQAYKAVSRENEQLPIAVQKRQLIEENLRQLVNINPAAVYTCQADGTILYYNQQAVELWGQELNLQDKKWTPGEAWRVYLPDGTLLQPKQWPAQQVFATGIAIVNRELIIERPDRTRIHVLVNINPIRNAAGVVSAAVNVFQDITDRVRLESDRQRAEVALQESESRLKLALKIGKLGSWQLDLKTNELLTSDQCKANYGLSPDADFSHQVLLNRIHPDDRAWVEAAIQQVIEQHLEYDVEYRNVWDDGSIHWALVRGCTFYDSDGTPLQMQGMSLDITDRKQAEAELQASEERFRNMADNAPMMVWVTDATGYCTYLSRSWYDFTGQTETTGLGFGWLGATHPDDRESSQAIFLAANDRQQAFQLEYRLRRQDGQYRTCIDAAKPWFGVDGVFKGYIGSVIDIDERKLAEAALRQSEERYRTLFESIDEGFCIVEMLFDENDTPSDYRFLEINPVFEQQTGLQQAVGKTARQLVPDLEDHWFEIYGQVALTGESVRFENGSEPMNRWFDVYACRTGQPSERKVAIVFKDISDRKLSEAILQRTAALNTLRVSFTDALRPLADPVEIQATASRVLGEYLGANRVAYFEVRGANYVVERDYVNEVDALAGSYPIDSFGSKLLAAYRTGRAVSVSDVAADPNLSPEQRSAYAAIQIGAYIGIPLLKEGVFVAGLAVHAAGARDWTPDEVALTEEVAERTWAAVERARAEAALRDSENRFRTAIESAQLGTWDWNLITNQLTWDRGCKAMFGLPPATEISIEVFFAGLHPDDKGRLERVIQVALSPASDGKYDIEYRTIGLQDGVERWISAKGQAYFDAAGKPQRFVGTVLNITEQKRIEAEREQLLAREQAAREAADRANRVKDEFLAVLSHELRSPLNPILGWSKLLQQGKLDTTRTKTALATIERNAQLQAQLIEDLLDISRILRGKLSLNQMPVDLRIVISSALETVHLAAQAKALQIQTIFPPEIGIVMGDAGRLQQVVWNLLSNAVKFTPQGGQITIILTQEATHAQIQVRDTGKGINPEFLPYVFEHFRQEDAATTRNFGGLGLGLAIACQIVEMHGGTITVDSPGKAQGATFTVQLPLASVSTLTLSSAISSVSTDDDLSDIHILVVDDETDSREFVAFVLEQAGAIIKSASSAIEALQAIEQFIPDLIVSDIGMPEMDGYMLMQQIRVRSPARQVPAIALTAYAGEFDRQQALQAGFQRHLAKPVEPTEIVKIAARLCGRKGGL
ncbi:PAS domain S-box protein [Nostoc sp. CHAB 5844]|nr:PAS domain S-box protein [Nostoc sp. CHAB 5844]